MRVYRRLFLKEWLLSGQFWINALILIAGCTILGIGIAMEVKCGSLTMPGEGITIAIHKVTGLEFPKVKKKDLHVSRCVDILTF